MIKDERCGPVPGRPGVRRSTAVGGVRGGACMAVIALLVAACGSGLTAQQAQLLARQTRTATATEFWAVYGEITPAIQHFHGDSADGGFGPCPEVSRADLVSYGISADIFPVNQGRADG